MPSVVFLRAVNVGGTNRCQPAQIAKQLAKFGVVNIGAVGTFVVSESVNESTLRAAIAKKLPFKCEIMICPARDVIKLAAKYPFSRQPSGRDITRFVSVLAKPLRAPFPLPLNLPSDEDWLLKIIAIQDRFVLGLYRRHESDQLPQQDRETARCRSNDPQLEYNSEDRGDPKKGFKRILTEDNEGNELLTSDL